MRSSRPPSSLCSHSRGQAGGPAARSLEGEPAYVSVHIGQSSLGIGKQTETGDLTNDRVTLWVYADDCATAIERLRTERVPVVQQPATQPWGERIAIVTDPDGNRVIIAAR